MILDFNANWSFYKYGQEDKKQEVTLPHDAMILEERGPCLNGVNSGFFPGGRYIYTKEFEINKDDIGKYIAIFFEGVYRNATIYLNDEKVLFHAYGYTEFEVDISNLVKEGKNIVKVDVDNSLEPNSRWYSGSGIYRPVSLFIKDKNYIKNVKVETVSINPATIKVTCDNKDAKVEVYDNDKLVSNSKCGEIVIKDAKLWDDINPNLYKIVVKNDVDEESLMYGIRELKWSVKEGVTINGREVKFRGSCIHHDNGIIGAIDLPDASDRRIRILKEQGYNAIRSAHNPCSREILNACDKYGVYVMDESFDMWFIPKTYHDYSRNFYDNYEADIKAMINKDYNHSSVVMYSIGNENSEPATEKGLEYLAKQANLMKELDKTRIITQGANLMLMNGMNVYKDTGEYKAEPLDPSKNKDTMAKLEKTGSTGFNIIMGMIPNMMTKATKRKSCGVKADNCFAHLDVLGLNYAYPRYEIDFKRDPNRIYVGSETFNMQIYKNWCYVEKYHQLLGDFCWTGWDYLGEAGSCGAFDYFDWPGRPIADGAGAIDLIGYPTCVNYYMQVVYGTYTKPYIAVEPASYHGKKYQKGGWRMNNYIHSWSWDGYEGTPVVVEVYSKAYKVQLVLNDKVVGVAKTKEAIAKFKVKYASGTLKAIALDENNNNVGEDILVTADKDTQITLTYSRESMSNNNQDLCYLNIDLTDSKGNIKPTREDLISIEIGGSSATLAGFGTARTKIEGAYNKTSVNAHFGKALAIFRATEHVGHNTITVKVNGLESKSFVLKVK